MLQSGYLPPGIEIETAYGPKEFSTNDRVIFRERIDLRADVLDRMDFEVKLDNPNTIPGSCFA